MAKMADGLAYQTFPDHFPSVHADLKKRYDEKGRHYHAWAHVEALLKHQSGVLKEIHDPVAVELAIYYHDAIYKPLSKTNEADSARLFEAELGGVLPEHLIRDVAVMIKATAGHVLPEALKENGRERQLSDCCYFLDMDISILGAEPELYHWYEAAIRKEYKLVPGPLFRSGRKNILQSFLDRDELYFTEHFRDRYEEQARANLGKAIKAL